MGEVSWNVIGYINEGEETEKRAGVLDLLL